MGTAPQWRPRQRTCADPAGQPGGRLGHPGFFEHALRVQGGLEHVPPLAELSSTTAIKAAVAAGAGPAVLSSLAVAADLASGSLLAVRVIGLDLHRDLRAVWPAGRPLTGPARDLVALASRRAG